MRTRLTIAAVVLALVGAALFFVLRNRGAGEAPAEAADAGAERSALVAQKLAARARGEIDLSPCSASGRVTRAEDGNGIAGALVLLSPKGIDDGVEMQAGQPRDPLTARTDAGGGWSIPKLPPGHYTLSASAPDHLPAARRDLVLRAGQDNPGLDLVLEAGGHTLRGTVSDIGGGAVEGVLIRVVQMDEGSPMAFDKAPFGTPTDEDGSYRLQLRDGDYAVSTFHADYVNETRITSIRDGPRVEDFTLTPSGVVEGVVLSRVERTPLAGAIVTFQNARGAMAQGGGGFAISGMGDGKVVTDDAGRFRLRGLQSGVVEIRAVAEGYASREATAVPLGVAEQVSGVEVLLDRAFKISGFVVAGGEQAEGLEGVLVGAFAFQPPSLMIARAPSETDGYFEILGVQAGTYTIGAMGEEALPNLLGTSATVVDQDVTDVLVTMNRGVSIKGRVDPPAPARVSIGMDAEEMSFSKMLDAVGNGMARTVADEDGNFELSPVAPGKLKLIAKTPDGRKGEIEVEVGPDGAQDVLISLEPGASVSGKVLDAKGLVVTNVSVSVTPKKRGAGGFNMNPMGDGVATGEDGTFAARGLDAGAHEILVKDRRGRVLPWAEPDDPEKPMAAIELDLGADEQHTGLELVVEARNGVLRGTVVGPDGAPMPDAWVTASREMSEGGFAREFGGDRKDDGKELRAKPRKNKDEDFTDEIPLWFAETPVLTDAQGSFVVEDLREGSYALVAEGLKGSARAKQRGVAVGSTVTLRLEQLAGIAGKVSSKGKAVREYSVRIKGPMTRSKTVYSDDGSFVIDRIDPGAYEVLVEAAEGTAEAEAEVEADETTRVELELAGWGKVRGILVDAKTGEALPGVAIMAMSEGGNAGGEAIMSMFTGIGPRTDAQGRFEVGKLGPGKGSITFMDRDAAFAGGSIARKEFELDAGEEKDLGTIQGIRTSTIAPDERGDLGLSTRGATLEDRPRHPDDEDDEASGDDDGATGDAPAQPKRLWVASVTLEGPAAEAGIAPGDEVISVDGTRVDPNNVSAAQQMLSSTHVRAGQDVSIEFESKGSRKTVTVTAVEKKRD